MSSSQMPYPAFSNASEELREKAERRGKEWLSRGEQTKLERKAHGGLPTGLNRSRLEPKKPILSLSLSLSVSLCLSLSLSPPPPG